MGLETTKRERWFAKRLQADFRKKLADKEFRRIAWWLIETCRTFEDHPIGNAGLTGHAEGKRSVGLAVYRHIHAIDPKLIAQLESDYREAPEYGQFADEKPTDPDD